MRQGRARVGVHARVVLLVRRATADGLHKRNAVHTTTLAVQTGDVNHARVMRKVPAPRQKNQHKFAAHASIRRDTVGNVLDALDKLEVRKVA